MGVDGVEISFNLEVDELSAICHPGVNDSMLRTLRTGAAGVAEVVDSAFRRSAPGAAAEVVVVCSRARLLKGVAGVCSNSRFKGVVDEISFNLEVDELSAICHPGVNDSMLRTLRTGAAGLSEAADEMVDGASLDLGVVECCPRGLKVRREVGS